MFEKVNSKVVRVNLAQAGDVLARQGSMLFYTGGEVSFSPQTSGGFGLGGPPGMSGGGLMGAAGRRMSGEHEAMMWARGTGEVYYGRHGLHVTVVPLQGRQLTAEMSRVLAHTGGLQASVVSVSSASGGGGGGLRGMFRGAVAATQTGTGMFTTQFSGQGTVVLLSHGPCIELEVGGMNPVFVDPQSYIGHVGNVQLELATALSWRDAVGRGSGEAFQLKMLGQGTVYVQPSEEKL